MRGRTEAKQADALARLDTGDPQAAEADDASAKERSGVQIVERCGQRENKVSPGNCVLRIPSRDGVPGESGRVAEIFQTSLAVGASTVGSAEPGNADARAAGNFFRGAADNFTDDLMAWNHARLLGRQVAFDDMQIGAANTTGTHSQENMSDVELRSCDVGDLQRSL